MICCRKMSNRSSSGAYAGIKSAAVAAIRPEPVGGSSNAAIVRVGDRVGNPGFLRMAGYPNSNVARDRTKEDGAPRDAVLFDACFSLAAYFLGASLLIGAAGAAAGAAGAAAGAAGAAA